MWMWMSMSMSHHTCVHCGHWWPARRGQTPLGPQEPQIGSWSQTRTSRLDVFQGWPENVPWEGRTEIFSCLDPLVIVTNSQENNLDVLIVIFVPRKKNNQKSIDICLKSQKEKSTCRSEKLCWSRHDPPGWSQTSLCDDARSPSSCSERQ